MSRGDDDGTIKRCALLLFSKSTGTASSWLLPVSLPASLCAPQFLLVSESRLLGSEQPTHGPMVYSPCPSAMRLRDHTRLVIRRQGIRGRKEAETRINNTFCFSYSSNKFMFPIYRFTCLRPRIFTQKQAATMWNNDATVHSLNISRPLAHQGL